MMDRSIHSHFPIFLKTLWSLSYPLWKCGDCFSSRRAFYRYLSVDRNKITVNFAANVHAKLSFKYCLQKVSSEHKRALLCRLITKRKSHFFFNLHLKEMKTGKLFIWMRFFLFVMCIGAKLEMAFNKLQFILR